MARALAGGARELRRPYGQPRLWQAEPSCLLFLCQDGGGSVVQDGIGKPFGDDDGEEGTN